MKLYCSVNSPYARKCRVALREKKIDCEEALVNSLENPPQLLAANPLGKVPSLLLSDGSALNDSTVILEYLDSLNDAPRLIPAAGKARFDVLGLAAMADGVMDLAVEWVIQTRRAQQQQWPDWIERRREGILRTVAVMAKSPLLTEKQLTLAQINAGCALAYLDFRHPTLDWRGSNQALATFADGFKARPSMQATASIA